MWVWAVLKNIPGLIGCWLRRLYLKNCKSGVMIWDGVTIEYADFLTIGCNSSINRGGILNCAGGISIGDNVLVGPRVLIYSQNHNFKIRDKLINTQGYMRKSVLIGDDVWISADVKIMPGVNVKRGSVIAAGAVVTKSTDEFGIYAGIPAIKIGERGL